MPSLQRDILRTLLYYDIWEYPLNARELTLFLPTPMQEAPDQFRELFGDVEPGWVQEHEGFYFVRGRTAAIVDRRRLRQRHARRMWKMARLSMHLIKRFPFVRAVFVSGDLSKNATGRGSDVDFFILTEPGRLWIARTLLILFKKVFLFNSKKFFCLNYFKTTDHLTECDRNIYNATEVAHLKPLYNSALYTTFMEANVWISHFFPNFRTGQLPCVCVNNRRSFLQLVIEMLLLQFPLDRIDSALMEKMRFIWARRYPYYDDVTRDQIFRCTKHESRAYVGNFQERILSTYAQKLQEFGIPT